MTPNFKQFKNKLVGIVLLISFFTITNLSAQTNAGIDISVCTSTAVLNAEAPPNGYYGTWTITTGSGYIAHPSLYNASVSEIALGTNIFRWTITNGVVSYYDEVKIINNSVLADAGLDQDICNNATNMTANNPAPGTGYWINVSGSGNIVNSTSFNTAITNIAQGPNMFSWNVTSPSGCSKTDYVVITNKSVYVFAGDNQAVCLPQANLAGNQPGAGAGSWSVTSGQGTFAQTTKYNTVVTNLGNGANTFKWTITYQGCYNDDEVIIINNYQDADAGLDVSICTNTISLVGNNPSSGSGVWTTAGGTGTFTNSNNYSTSVNAVGTGSNLYVWTISSAGCTFSDTVRITNNSFPVNAGVDQSVCRTNAQMTANDPATLPGTGRWTVDAGTAIFSNFTLFNTNVSGLQSGQNTLRWTVNANGCTGSDIVVITNGLPGNATTAPDQIVCTDTVYLPNYGTGVWSKEGDSVIITNLKVILDKGPNTFLWTVTYNNCSSVDTIVITNNNFTISAGLDQTICSDSVYLSGQDPISIGATATGNWSVASGSATIVIPSQYNTIVRTLGTAGDKKTTFAWNVTHLGCTSSDNVVITNNMVTANAGLPQTLCANSTLLSANDPGTNNHGKWTIASGSGNFANDTLFNTAVTNLWQGPNTLRWTVSGLTNCRDSSTTTVTNNSIVAFAGIDQALCTDSTVLSGNNPSVGATGTWTLVVGSGRIVNSTLFNTKVTGLGIGANQFQWRINNLGCFGTDVVNIANNSHSVSAGNAQNICDFNTNMLASNPPAGGVGNWTVQSGFGVFANSNLQNTSVNNIDRGTNTFRWTVVANGCTFRDDVIVTNNYVDVSAGQDKTICSETTTLAGSDPGAGGLGVWTLAGGDGYIVTSTSATSVVDSLNIGSNNLVWTVNRNGCSNSDMVRITNNKPFANAGVNQNVCVNTTTLNANPPAVGETGVWTQIGAATFIIASPSNFISAVTNLGKGSNRFRWTVTGNGCTAYDQVTVTNNSPSPANAGKDTVFCGNVIQLTATNPISGTGYWSIIEGNGVFSNSNQNNAVVSNLANYVSEKNDVDNSWCGWCTKNTINKLRWTVVNGSCSVWDEVEIINANPIQADAGEDQVVCGNKVSMNGKSGDLWFNIGNSQAIIENPSVFNTTINNLAPGLNVFRYRDTNIVIMPYGSAYCSINDSVSIYSIPNFKINISAGEEQLLCDSSTILQAINPSSISYSADSLSIIGQEWSLIKGKGEFENNQLYNTRVNHIKMGENSYRWSITFGIKPNILEPPFDTYSSCMVSGDVTIVNALPSAAKVESEQLNSCNNFITLKAFRPTRGTGLWSQVSGASTTISAQTCDSTGYCFANVSNLTSVETKFQYETQNSYTTLVEPFITKSCYLRDTISVIKNQVIANAGVDQSVCRTSATLNANNPASGTGQWSLVAGSGTIQHPTNQNSTVTNLNNGANVFRWTITINGCSASDDVTITNNSVTADAGVDRTICENAIVLNALPAPVGSSSAWSVVVGGGTFNNINSYNTRVNGIAPGANVFRWTLTTGSCQTFDDLIITNNMVLETAGDDQQVCGDSVFLGADDPGPTGSGYWSVVGGHGYFTNSTLSGTYVDSLYTGTNTFSWTVHKNACTGTDVVAITSNRLFAEAGSSDTVYVDNTTMGATLGAGESGVWTVVGGNGYFVNDNDQYTDVDSMVVGTNIFQWTVTKGACQDADIVTIVYAGIPVNPDSIVVSISFKKGKIVPKGKGGGIGKNFKKTYAEYVIQVPLCAKDFKNISTYQYSIHWNSNVAVLDSIFGFGLEGLDQTSFNKLNDSTLTLLWIAPNGDCKSVSDSTQLFVLQFAPALGANHQKTALSFSNNPLPVSFYNCELKKKIFTLENGLIELPALVKGQVHYYNNHLPIDSTKMIFNNDSSQYMAVDNNGGYSMIVGSTDVFQIKPERFLNAPLYASATSNDMFLLKRHLLGIEAFNSPYKVIASDVNSDSIVDNSDLLRILKYITTTDQSWFPNGIWHFVNSDQTFANMAQPFPFQSCRNYNETSTNFVNQDFIGAQKGDVDNSWTGQTALHKKDMSNISFFLGEPVFQGNQVEIPIQISGFNSVGAFQYGLNWDPEYLQFAEVKDLNLNGLSLDNFGLNLTNTGNLTTAWYAENGIGESLVDQSKLYSVKFNVLNSNTTQSIVSINNAIIPNEVSGTFGVEDLGEVVSSLQLGTNALNFKPEVIVYPNPFVDQLQISISGKVDKISITDISGRVLLEELTYNQTHISLQTSDLGSGFYFLNFISGDKTIITKKIAKADKK